MVVRNSAPNFNSHEKASYFNIIYLPGKTCILYSSFSFSVRSPWHAAPKQYYIQYVSIQYHSIYYCYSIAFTNYYIHSGKCYTPFTAQDRS